MTNFKQQYKIIIVITVWDNETKIKKDIHTNQWIKTDILKLNSHRLVYLI